MTNGATGGTAGHGGTGALPAGGSAGSGGSTGGVGGAGGAGGTGGGSGGSSGAFTTGGTGGSSGSVATGGRDGTGGMAGSGGAAGSAAGKGGAAGQGGVSGSAGGGGTGAVSGTGGAMGGSAGQSGGGSGGAAGGTSTCPVVPPLTGGKQYCSNTTGNAGGNYAYELWSSGTGKGCMTVYGKDANFSATWTGVDDFLARIGLGFDKSKTPSQIGTISAEFAETKTADTGLTYIGIYGWTVNPLKEYYILDDWGASKPGDTASDGTPRTHVGVIVVDGANYDVWKHTQTNKPAITGDNMTFDQYFSVRETARQCGHISISDHFSKWSGLGLELGKLEEAKILVEAQDNSGTVDFTTASMAVK